MNLAPIVLFVYNRPEHTRKTLEALRLNDLANESILYIYADGAKEDASKTQLDAVAATRKVIKEQEWCGDVVIIESQENKGLANSVINGVTEIITKYKKVIVLEDDILTGKYFLKFMNDALNIYENETKVFGVSGYTYPTQEVIDRETYFLPIGSSWSYGTWLDRWNEVNFDGASLFNEINNRKLKRKMNFGNYPFYEMLENQIAGKVDSWAIRFYTSMFLEGKLFLFPNKSLVQNIGFDNSGEHCEEDDLFSNVNVSNDFVLVQKQIVSVHDKIQSVFKKSFDSQTFEILSTKNKLMNFLKNLYLLITSVK
jgi:hypothetical protein